MKYVLPLLFLFTALAWCQSTPKKKATSKKTNSSKITASRKTASKTAVAQKGKSLTRSPKTASKSVKRAPAVARQTQPTPERYKEIQQALVDKGYLKSEPNGVWDAESSAALAQFQNDRKLPPTGKLTSASLIDLGLGPSTAPAAADSAPDSASHTTGAN